MSNEKRVYRVFVLYAEVPDNDPIVFVGRSKMKDARQLFRYLRNDCKKTTEFFEPGIEPSFFWLEDECMEKIVAYQNQIAWMRYFFELDYDILGDLKSYEDALDLYGPAKEIYNKLSKISVEEVLQRRHIVSSKIPEEADEQPSTETLSKRLSIRLTEKEYAAFAEFCEKRNVKQREGLQLLLMNGDTGDAVTSAVIAEQRQRITELEKENEKLKEKPWSVVALEKLRESFDFAKKGIHRYIRDQCEPGPGPKLMCPPWKVFAPTFVGRREYEYPLEGFLYFRLEKMCYGKGNYAAIFLYGTDDTGKRVKLRYYPRKEYCGTTPGNQNYMLEGACFLVGCRRLYPKVSDLVFMCPVPDWQEKEEVRQDLFGDVGALIDDAKKRLDLT